LDLKVSAELAGTLFGARVLFFRQRSLASSFLTDEMTRRHNMMYHGVVSFQPYVLSKSPIHGSGSSPIAQNATKIKMNVNKMPAMIFMAASLSHVPQLERCDRQWNGNHEEDRHKADVCDFLGDFR
jgi:hypothetical protein